jgi:hypothetical protein
MIVSVAAAARRHVVHDDEAIDHFRMILRKARRDPCTAIVAHERNALDRQFAQERAQIVRHRPLVVAGGGLLANEVESHRKIVAFDSCSRPIPA